MRNELIGEIERAFMELNKHLFDSELTLPPIMIDTKKKVAIRFMNEILVIGTEFVNIDYHDFTADLLHEMVHIANFQKDIVDCTANQYHNTKFLAKALEVGLVVQQQKSQGWGLTSTNVPKTKNEYRMPHKEAIQRRVKAFQKANLNRTIFKNACSVIGGKIKKAKPCFLKYVCSCPPPHNSIRSGRRPDGDHPLKIVCETCGSKFTFVE